MSDLNNQKRRANPEREPEDISGGSWQEPGAEGQAGRTDRRDIAPEKTVEIAKEYGFTMTAEDFRSTEDAELSLNGTLPPGTD